MRKRILSILLIMALLVTMLAGCKKDDEAVKDNAGKNESVKDDAESESESKPVPTMNLVTEGVTDYVIVRAKLASNTEVYAAEELRNYIEQISGVVLKIVTDDVAATAKEIVIGKTNRETTGQFDRTELGDDGFVIRMENGKLWLVGGKDRGTIYSVYTFLEDYLGCRFYTTWVEKVPETKTIAIPEEIDDKQIPQFVYRDISTYEYQDEDISAKRKINVELWGRELSDKVGGGTTIGGGGHTFAAMIPAEKYFKEHPEYFTLTEEGERVPNGQLCLTNPDVLKLMIAGVREMLQEDPTLPAVTVSQNDLQLACMCENCVAVYKEEGGALSGTLIRFINAIAEDIKEDYPNTYIDTYAYQYTRSAPTKTKPAENVQIRLCTIEDCYDHPHEEECRVSKGVSYLDGSFNLFDEDLKAWAAITDNLWIRDYCLNFAFSNIPFGDLDNLWANMRYYAEHGVNGIQYEGRSNSVSAEFGELRSYLLSKLYWDPYMSEDEYYAHMDDFLEGVYGPGAKYIRAYIDLVEDATEGLHFGIGWELDVSKLYPTPSIVNHETGELPDDLTVDMVKNYKNVDWTKYWNWYGDVKENVVTQQGQILFKKAQALAETDSQRLEIRKAYLQVEDLLSYYYYKRVQSGGVQDVITAFVKKNADKFTADEKKQLPKLIEELAYEQVCAEYEEFNKAFCQALIDCGVSMYDGGTKRLTNYLELDFKGHPPLWG